VNKNVVMYFDRFVG